MILTTITQKRSTRPAAIPLDQKSDFITTIVRVEPYFVNDHLVFHQAKPSILEAEILHWSRHNDKHVSSSDAFYPQSYKTSARVLPGPKPSKAHLEYPSKPARLYRDKKTMNSNSHPDAQAAARFAFLSSSATKTTPLVDSSRKKPSWSCSRQLKAAQNAAQRAASRFTKCRMKASKNGINSSSNESPSKTKTLFIQEPNAHTSTKFNRMSQIRDILAAKNNMPVDNAAMRLEKFRCVNYRDHASNYSRVAGKQRPKECENEIEVENEGFKGLFARKSNFVGTQKLKHKILGQKGRKFCVSASRTPFAYSPLPLDGSCCPTSSPFILSTPLEPPSSPGSLSDESSYLFEKFWGKRKSSVRLEPLPQSKYLSYRSDDCLDGIFECVDDVIKQAREEFALFPEVEEDSKGEPVET